MKNNVKEANVVMARCASTSKSFGIRMERRTDDVWYCTWAFPLSEKVLQMRAIQIQSFRDEWNLTTNIPVVPIAIQRAG